MTPARHQILCRLVGISRMARGTRGLCRRTQSQRPKAGEVGVGICREFVGGQRNLLRLRGWRLGIDSSWGQDRGEKLRWGLRGPGLIIRMCRQIWRIGHRKYLDIFFDLDSAHCDEFMGIGWEIVEQCRQILNFALIECYMTWKWGVAHSTWREPGEESTVMREGTNRGILPSPLISDI